MRPRRGSELTLLGVKGASVPNPAVPWAQVLRKRAPPRYACGCLSAMRAATSNE